MTSHCLARGSTGVLWTTRQPCRSAPGSTRLPAKNKILPGFMMIGASRSSGTTTPLCFTNEGFAPTRVTVTFPSPVAMMVACLRETRLSSMLKVSRPMTVGVSKSNGIDVCTASSRRNSSVAIEPARRGRVRRDLGGDARLRRLHVPRSQVRPRKYVLFYLLTGSTPATYI